MNKQELCVFITGFVDGWGAPDDLAHGLTFPDPKLNEVYDQGVNLGQALASALDKSINV